LAALRASHHELEAANEQLRVALSENEKLLERTKRAYLSTITSLARTIEAKDPYTGGHTERVAEYTLMLARELGFGDDELQAVEVGAVIHDIGKIGIPDRILLKPGRLDSDEFEEMRRHPVISSYILDELDLPKVVRDMARNHHERFDGKGYPDGLKGDQIPLAARILTVADAFDAMTSDRPYRRALSQEVAAAEIRRNTGTQFCPDVVAALEECLAGPGRSTQRGAVKSVTPALGMS
jgi:putative nucleotidyltransferase with HDIG domain